ncbi:MAG: twin-arginine translocation signal domain-containing protein [Hyphomicrobiaceae bacterium]|nr:twin-arginine translocation signal domain-containing protein [Hyphomicrobiaceae bacterium]
MAGKAILTRRSFVVGSGAAAASFSLGELMFPGSSHAAAKPKKGGKVVYAVVGHNTRHKSIKTARHPYDGIEIRTKNVFNTLTWVDEELGVQPEVATKWRAVEDDQTVWEVDIREGVKFHDGRDLRVEDVVASYNFHRDPKLGTSFAQKMLAKVEKVGPTRARFFLQTPNSEFPWWTAEYRQVIMPEAPLDKIGMDGIGSGPFKFAKIDPRRRVVYEANAKYWGDGPYLDTLEVVVQPNMGPAMNGYRSGQFDMILGVDPALVPQFQALPNTKVSFAKAGSQMMLVLPKHEGSPFKDVRIRKALSLAIDRQKIIDIVYGGKLGWMTNDTHMTNFNADFLPRKVNRDVAAAKKLLAEAGFPNGITLPTLYFTTYYPEISRVFQVLAESVKEAGITLPIEVRQESGYRKWRVEDKEKTRKHRFAMAPVGSRNPAANMFRMARPEYNESGYWHPSKKGDEYIALYKKAMRTGDAVKRRAIYHEMQRILQDEVPALFLIGRREIDVVRANVHGWSTHSQTWSARFNPVWKA